MLQVRWRAVLDSTYGDGTAFVLIHYGVNLGDHDVVVKSGAVDVDVVVVCGFDVSMALFWRWPRTAYRN